MVNAQLIFNVADRSYFALLKKEIHALAAEMGFVSEKAGKIDIIIAELVTNLVKHAGGGHLVVKQIIDAHSGEGLEILSIDNGPGISDLKRMMQDGVSTKSTLGHGLGSIQRLSDKSEIYTHKDWGTVVLSKMFKAPYKPSKKPEQVEVSSLVLPKPGEDLCGDGFYFKRSKTHLKVFLGDGLGHGAEAAKAVNAAIDAFRICAENDPVAIIRDMHISVRKSRGLVASIAIFDFGEKTWSICGVGNISTKINSFTNSRNYIAHNGIIGHNIPNTMKNQIVPYEAGQVLIMCSDGLKTRWELIKYPGILKYDLSVLTAALYKDHTRNNDDASVAAVKINI